MRRVPTRKSPVFLWRPRHSQLRGMYLYAPTPYWMVVLLVPESGLRCVRPVGFQSQFEGFHGGDTWTLQLRRRYWSARGVSLRQYTMLRLVTESFGKSKLTSFTDEEGVCCYLFCTCSGSVLCRETNVVECDAVNCLYGIKEQ